MIIDPTKLKQTEALKDLEEKQKNYLDKTCQKGCHICGESKVKYVEQNEKEAYVEIAFECGTLKHIICGFEIVNDKELAITFGTFIKKACNDGVTLQ